MLHDVNLNARRLGPEEDLVCDIEGVLGVARRMAFGKVERLEVVVIVLDLGAFRDLVAHTDEKPLHLLGDFVGGVKASLRGGSRRHRHVNDFLFERSLKLKLPELLLSLRDPCLDKRSHVVGRLSGCRSLLGAESAHELHDACDKSLFAEELDAKVLDAFLRFRLFDFLFKGLFYFSEFFSHIKETSNFTAVSRPCERSF